MERLLENQYAVVTGASRGMGKEIVSIFAQNGADVFACVRRMTDELNAEFEQLSQKNDVQIIPVILDLSNSDGVKAAAKEILKYKKTISILVNNAGVTYNALFQMTSMDEMRNVFEINFFAPILFSQYMVKLMQRNGSGSIVNIASTAGIDGNSGRTAYGGSKAALICATKVMAHELGNCKIRVNAIAPGMTDTGMLAGNIAPQIIQDEIQMKGIKRLGVVSDIARTALFLASDRSSFITGQIFRVDGGA